MCTVCEHHGKTRQQKNDADLDGKSGENEDRLPADDGSPEKAQNDPEIERGIFEIFFFFCFGEMTEIVDAGAEIADAHRRGNAVAVRFAEGLYLNAAGEGDHGVRDVVYGLRKEADAEEDQGLDQECILPPVKAELIAAVDMQKFCDRDAAGESHEREKIPEGFGKISPGDRNAEEKDIAGLGICEDVIPVQIGIGVHQSAGYGQKAAQPKGFGHMPMVQVPFHMRSFSPWNYYIAPQIYM